MSNASKPVGVTILEKEYIVACADDERESLYAAVDFLNDRMRELREGGKVIGNERIAVMAALNVAHEYLDYKSEKESLVSDVGTGIRRIQGKIADALKRGQRLRFSDAELGSESV